MDGFHAGESAWFVIRNPDSNLWEPRHERITQATRDADKVQYLISGCICPQSRTFRSFEAAERVAQRLNRKHNG